MKWKLISAVTPQTLPASSWRICGCSSVSWPTDDPGAMNYAWDPGPDYPHQYAVLIKPPKLPLNSFEDVGNVWDPDSPPLLLPSSFFKSDFHLKWVWFDSRSLSGFLTSLKFFFKTGGPWLGSSSEVSETSPLAAQWLDRSGSIIRRSRSSSLLMQIFKFLL